jgi:rhamnulokinase
MNYLAIDLGAESGRVILGTIDLAAIDHPQVVLKELQRIPNTPIRDGNSLRWNIEALWEGIARGITAIENETIEGISVDSWGVDYVLLTAEGAIIHPTYHYRDPRTKGAMDSFLSRVGWPRVFEETGIQMMPINTLFQLAAESRERLNKTHRVLGIADAFNHWLGGQACIEESLASTFQLYNPRTRSWSEMLLRELNLPVEKLPQVVQSGTMIGSINPQLKTDALASAKIVATCSHDTGAAVAAVPAQAGKKWAYLSSGTWSLMGVERAEPIINDLSRELNFTNEIGYGGSIRLLKNISGLWLLQECRRIWGQYNYGELTALAANEISFRSIINPADPRFLAPTNMPDEIAAFCRETDQPMPETPAQFTRCIFESLALLYRQTLQQLEKLTGEKIEVLHVVGGGAKNQLLNQFTADACQIDVLAGPVEATALGNIMIQAITLGEVADIASARTLIRGNFEMARFQSKNPALWMEAYGRFEKLREHCHNFASSH